MLKRIGLDKHKVKVIFDKKLHNQSNKSTVNYPNKKAVYQWEEDGAQSNVYPYQIYFCVLAYAGYLWGRYLGRRSGAARTVPSLYQRDGRAVPSACDLVNSSVSDSDSGPPAPRSRADHGRTVTRPGRCRRKLIAVAAGPGEREARGWARRNSRGRARAAGNWLRGSRGHTRWFNGDLPRPLSHGLSAPVSKVTRLPPTPSRDVKDISRTIQGVTGVRQSELQIPEEREAVSAGAGWP
eukprot:767477-Hanusia_phi.AAC.1